MLSSLRPKGPLHGYLRLLLGCLAALALPTGVWAQSRPDLIMTVRDVKGTPLAGLTVQLRASAETPVLAQAITDAQGQVTFANISVSQVRVAVIGTLANGTRLYQPGADAQGAMLLLGPPPTRLDLRVDADGMVLPDPATMIDPVANGPAVVTPAGGPSPGSPIVFPTSATYAPPIAPPASAASLAASPLASTLPTSPAPVASPAAAGAVTGAPAIPTILVWLGWIVAATVLIGGLLALVLKRGRQI
jgi:hypothetical protein